MRWNIICGGPAGLGPNFLANLISHGLVQKGFYVFASREYESRIRGGHNFNIITFSDQPLTSNIVDIDLLVALDDLSVEKHQKEMKKTGLIVKGNSRNAFAAGAAFKILGIDFSILDSELKKISHYDENVKEAKEGYDSEKRELNLPKLKINEKTRLVSGNEGVAYGAIESGIEFYYGYPMTPATGLLFELAKRESEKKYVTTILEGEIAVVNAAIGSAITGAKAMCGTSGGGFDLMSEALSLAGGAQIPLVMHLAQRPGPATGAATDTAQGDLSMARHSGHGEFVRVIATPGDPIESSEKTSELFYLTQKYRIPGILLTDKHLLDSFFTLTGNAKIKQSQKSIVWPSRFTSYEANDEVVADSSAQNVKNSVEKRKKIYERLSAEIEKLNPFEIYGKTKSKNLIIGWGSTKGAIMDAINGLDCKYIHLTFIEPFSKKIKSEIEKAKKVVIVENNASSPLSALISEKTGFIVDNKNKILKYDGRPFYYPELMNEIKKRLK